MDSVKKVKRGEVLFKEGESPKQVYVVQSGKVGLLMERTGKGLEVAALGPGQVLGEHALFSNAKYEFTAEALQEARVLELSIETMRQQLEKTPPGIKLLVKSLVDDLRQARKFMKTVKMETESKACPQGIIHRLFTQVHLIARHIGKANPENPKEITVSWNALKLYCNRFFGESPQRLRQLMDLLAKIKTAQLMIGKSEEGVEELQEVKFLNVQIYEDFAEFFQYHLFKGSRSEAIYVDPLALKVARAFAELSEGAPVDHKGASRMDWSQLLNECKTKYRIELKNTHLDILERKGLFVKRKSFDDGKLEISFDRNEFVNMVYYWGILHEIDKWNELGYVDLNEKEEVVQEGPAACPSCQQKIEVAAKFCPNCGFKLASAA